MRTVDITHVPPATEFTDGIYIIPKRIKFDPILLETIARVENLALSLKVPVITTEEQLAQREDPLIITIGGDGTALRGFKLGAIHGVPVITVNLGKLGFLADISPEKVKEEITKILEGKYILEKRMVLEDQNGNIAANEFYISHADPGRLFHYSVYVDNVLASQQSADGVIIGTPTGSTAYSLAAGGAILATSMRALQVVPVAPHTLTSRPLVVSWRSQVAVEPTDGYYIKADGRLVTNDAGRITISPYKSPVTILHPEGWNFYSTLSNKLDWNL